MLEPLGLAAGPVVPTREWRELYSALDCAAVAAIHPFYTASVREFEAAAPAGRRVRTGRSSTVRRTPGSESVGKACAESQPRKRIDAAKQRNTPRYSRRALRMAHR